MTPTYQLRQMSDQELIQRCYIEQRDTSDTRALLLERFTALADAPVVELGGEALLGEVDELFAQLPAEDFLSENLSVLSEVARQLTRIRSPAAQRAAEQLQTVITQLEDIQQQQAYASEYAAEKMRDLTKMLNP